MEPVIFHLPSDWVADPSRMLPFYRKITGGLAARGVDWHAVAIERAGIEARIAAMPGRHVVNHGRVVHPRAWNAGIAYVYPFWHLDPEGIRAFSSIGGTAFDPRSIDGEEAKIFFRRLRARLVEARASRYEQPAEVAALPRAGAAVFLQSEGHRTVGETLYLDRWTMLETVLRAVAGPVLVKPHPRDLDPATGEGLERLGRRFPNLVVTTANIHDVIGVSERVVTINSAVGIEAYLHRKPVILCGRADFHHIAVEARDVAGLAAALTAPAPVAPYAKYIRWYFGTRCLNAGAEDLVDRFLERISEVR